MDNWAIMASVNLPIWFERIEAGIRRARRELSAARERYAAARDRVRYEVRDALARVEGQRDLADILATTIIPQARQTYEVSLGEYTAGTSEFESVIENWQRWLRFRIQYHRAVGEGERSIADLEEAVGVSVVELTAGTSEGAGPTSGPH
jgi:outer membrane protein TolC